MPRLKHLLTFARPYTLLLAGMTYTLGISIARYLGRADNPLAFGLGFGWVILVVMAMNLLAVYFRPHEERLIKDEPIQEQNWLRAAAFQLSVAELGVAAVITVFLLQQNITPTAFTFAAILLVVAMLYALPPLRLVNSGFGEQILAAQIAAFVPAFSLALQTGDVHRLLSAAITPIILLAIAYFLVLNFATYKDDIKYERRTLLTRAGWERAVNLHHIIIFLAYLSLAAMPLLGLPSAIFFPLFYIAPLALLQIFTLHRISQGAPANWTFLTTLAASVIGLTIYIFIITFWIR